MTRIADLAELVRPKNAADAAIAAIVGRPALIGHVGESIASQVFGIALEASASARCIDALRRWAVAGALG